MPKFSGEEKRSGSLQDTGQRRRKNDEERMAEFRLLRDKVLLGVGVAGVLGLAIAAVTIGVKDSALALAALAVFGGLLGAPTVLRLDERSSRSGGNPG